MSIKLENIFYSKKIVNSNTERKNHDIKLVVYKNSDGTYSPFIYFETITKGKKKYLKTLGLNIARVSYRDSEEVKVSFRNNKYKALKDALLNAYALEPIAQKMQESYGATYWVNSIGQMK